MGSFLVRRWGFRVILFSLGGLFVLSLFYLFSFYVGGSVEHWDLCRLFYEVF